MSDILSADREVSNGVFYQNMDMDDDPKKKLSDLVEAREKVKDLVEEAIKNGEEIMHDVRTWLSSADEAIKGFFQDAVDAKIKCFISPSSRRHPSRRANDILSQLLAESKFHVISYSCRPPFLSVLASDLQEFDSRKPILEGLMEAFFDDDVKVIGVWGTAGVGKTTLVTQAAGQAHFFSVIVSVFVTGNPDMGKIQTEIADALGMKLEEEGVTDRAAKLRMRLEREKRVLLILDYVWGPLNLVEMEKEIGIPEARVKMVVLSRDESVLLQMEAQKIFLIERLPQNEALFWFLKVSRVTESDYPFCDFAVDIVNKCGGLPVLLLAVANTLRNKDFSVWNAAWWQLERNYEDVYLAVFSILDMSLEYLESYERNMLVLCAALGEEISLELLLKISFGCPFSRTSNVEDARRRMVKHIRTLEGLSLLQAGYTSDFVTLDNAIRHRALRASHNMFVVRDGYEHKKWPHDDLIPNITAIFLLGNHKGELPQRLTCPKLELLHVYDESRTLAIPDGFFEQINRECFQVLSLINMKLSSLPLSIRLLTNIQTLCLDKCELGDISLVGDLSNLKVLSLLGSTIDQLPYHIRNLTNLCLLDLRNCSKIERIPPNVISNLTSLQELLLPNSFGQWQYSDGSNDERTNASIDELSNLNNLQALDIHIPDEMVIPQELPLNILRRYNISIGQLQGQWSRNFTRNLQLNLSIDIEEYNWVKVLLKDAEELWLKELKGFKAFQLDNEGFPKLRHLHILDTAEIEYLIEPMQENPFPYLESLVLNNLINFKMLWHSQAYFYALRVVTVKHCDALEFIFSLPNISRYVSELAEMEITNCSNLESIVRKKEDAYGGFKFSQLRSLTLQNLPKLVGFLTTEVTQEESLNSCPLFCKVKSPILKQLNLRGLDQLTNICKDPHFKDKYEFETPDLEKLNELGLDQLTNIWFDPLFRDNYQLSKRGLDQLKILCKDTRYWDNYQVEFPILEQLNLHRMYQLTSICKGSHLSFSMLKSLQLFGCDNLKYLFSLPVAEGLLHLLEIKVVDCRSIEEIVAIESETAAVTPTDMIVLPKVTTLIFESLAELRSFCWDGLIFEWQSLKKVRVVKCPKITWGALGIVDKSKLEVEVKDCPWQKDGEPESSAEYLFFKSDLLLTETVMDLKSSEDLRLLETKLQPLSFRKLKMLSASNCDERLTEFLSQLLPRLYELEQLEVKQCELLTQIVNLQRLVADKNRKGKYFTQLKTIKLRDLPKLSCICDKDPAGIHFLHNLQEIEIHNCGSLKSIFPTSLVQQLRKLKVIKVHSCPAVEDVFDLHSEEETGRTEIVLPRLEYLELVHLQNFTKLEGFQFPLLRSLRIEDCPLMDELDSGSANRGKSKEMLGEVMVPYQNVQNLKLVNLHRVEEIWKGFSSPTSFSELKEVEVNNLSKLKCAISSKMLPILKNLEKLTINNCSSLTEVFELHEGFDFPSARFPPSTRGLSKLQILQVTSCENLHHVVFPSKCLNKLRSLEISKCKILEQVFQFTDFHISEETYLESIVLEQLPKLSSFCWEKLEFPSLVEARIIDCPELKTFPSRIKVPERLLPSASSSREFSLQSPEAKSILPAASSAWDFFLTPANSFKDFSSQPPEPESLPPAGSAWDYFFPELESLPAANSFQDSFSQPQELEGHLPASNSFYENDKLSSSSSEALELPPVMPESLPLPPAENSFFTKDKLSSSSSEALELPPVMPESLPLPPAENSFFTKDKLSSSSSEALELPPVMPESLPLPPAENSFFTKDKLSSSSSEALELPPVMPESLPLPPAENSFFTKDKLSSSSSEALELPPVMPESLPLPPAENSFFTKDKLSSSSSEALELPPVMPESLPLPPAENSFFTKDKHSSSSSKTQEVSALVPESLPTGSSFFTNDKDPFRKLQKLHIRNMNYCIKIWNEIPYRDFPGELKFMVLESSSTLLNIIPSSMLIWMQNLEEITVKECTALKVAFEIAADYSNEIVQQGLLPQLKELTLIDLPEMELWKQEPAAPVFKNLKLLEIIGCCSLKKLFSISIAKNLEQLELLKLYECEKMEQILEGEVESTKTLEFPNLKCIILKHLPNLTCFCRHDCDINLPALEMFRVKDIPKMETFAKGTRTPNLKEVYVTYVTKCWQGELNKTIKYLYDHPEQARSSSNGHGRIPSEMLCHYEQEEEESAIVPVSRMEPQEHEGSAQQTQHLVTEVPEEAMVLAAGQSPNYDNETTGSTGKSPHGERVAFREVDDDKESLMNVVEEILEACERRPGFLPVYSDALRRVLSQYPVLTGPFRGRSSYFAAMSYELLASVLLKVEGRNLTQMLDADFNALLMQLEELKMIGFDHSWLESLRDSVIAQRERNFVEIEVA